MVCHLTFTQEHIPRESCLLSLDKYPQEHVYANMVLSFNSGACLCQYCTSYYFFAFSLGKCAKLVLPFDIFSAACMYVPIGHCLYNLGYRSVKASTSCLCCDPHMCPHAIKTNVENEIVLFKGGVLVSLKAFFGCRLNTISPIS